jgi:hypothetical protein
MPADHQPAEAICSGCPRCPSGDHPTDEPDSPLLYGWRLGLSAIGLFLGPVVLAIVGVLLFGDSPASQLAGAMVGLGVGLAVSVGVAKVLPPEVGSGG